MLNDLTFKEITKFLENEDGKLLNSVDKILGLAIICSPIVFGPLALPALGVLRVKGELTNLAQSLLKKVVAKKETDYMARMDRMRIAYGLICFTSFFEALDRLLPEDLRKGIDLQPTEKERLADQASKRVGKQSEVDGSLYETQQEGALNVPLPFPHPAANFEEQTEQVQRLYTLLTEGFVEFLKKLAVWEEADGETTAKFEQMFKVLPGIAMECFEGQYIELTRKFNDFCVWSRLHEHKTTQGKLKNISDYLKKHAALVAMSEKKIGNHPLK